MSPENEGRSTVHLTSKKMHILKNSLLGRKHGKDDQL